jgi:hypothetical protein
LRPFESRTVARWSRPSLPNSSATPPGCPSRRALKFSPPCAAASACRALTRSFAAARARAARYRASRLSSGS